MSTPRLTFRCSERHSTRARNRAKREGVPLSVALRSLLIAYADGRLPTVKVAHALEGLRQELRRIGVNLNQCAHALNMGQPTELRPVLGRIATACRRLHKILADHVLPRRPS